MIAYLRKSKKNIKRPAVFFDRDGTIIRDRPGFYLTDPARLRVYKSSFKAMKAVSSLGYRLIVITNQAAVGRGYMTLKTSIAINLRLCREMTAKGVHLDGIYFCPHHPDAGCRCRKPAPGLIKEALKHHRIDLPRSIVVGDKACDMKLADSLGLTSVLVKSGHGQSELREHPGLARGRAVKKGILEAAAWIRAQANGNRLHLRALL